ncbi:MAG TPA: SAM-dependent methyltransferase [Deltaproteobacteria bacterium]|nr:SAM-dependent methyltransferase [Deltaproteobacteria bacterium]HCP46354.1 SAM-dependent methyltransferase [Deltaproteobacteria bacterium]
MVSADTLPAVVFTAIDRRRALLERLHQEQTDCYRLFHGAVEGRPGLAVDRYGPVLLVQSWGDGPPQDEVEAMAAVARDALGAELQLAWNIRVQGRRVDGGLPGPEELLIEGRELGVTYDVRPRGRKLDPPLFLDLRAGRRRVMAEARGLTVLNMFAYTCGLGVVAGVGGASSVTNVDFSSSVLEIGRANALRNGLDLSRFQCIACDGLVALRQLAGLPIKGRARHRREYPRIEPRQFDLVLLDPPGWSKGPFGAVDLVRDYPAVLKPAVLATREGGALLITNNVASVELEPWIEIVRACARKAGRNIRALEVISPEEDFPSPDERPPLKMLWLSV